MDVPITHRDHEGISKEYILRCLSAMAGSEAGNEKEKGTVPVTASIWWWCPSKKELE